MAGKKAAKKAQKKAGTPVGKSSETAGKSAAQPLRIVLLDSHAILHRAYHAIPDFSKSNGEPTGALYGLLLTLLKITETLKPDYIVATRDLPGKTVRHDAFEQYKATRAEVDPELVGQLKQAPKLFEAFGIPVYCKEGYEADDMLGTIVEQTSGRRDLETIIATGDSDTLQLVRPRVKVFMLRTGIADTVIYDEEGVRLKYGFGPERVIDYKGIVGDASDNIPGIPGVGATSAQKLIAAYGDLAGIYTALKAKGVEAVAKETGVRKQYVEKVAAHEKEAMFSKQLATIHHDVPIGFALPKTPYRLEDHAATIVPFLDEFEFRSVKERLKAKLGTISRGEELAGAPTDVDPTAFEETALALWLLHSDATAPSVADILTYARTTDFEAARAKIFKELRETGRLQEVYDTIEKPLIPIVRRMHDDGIYVDVKYLASLQKEYRKGLAELAGRIYRHAGHEFNINSPKQLGAVLYDELQISAGGKQKKTATGARTTREEELSKMADLHPIIGDILAYRELQKLLSTYIEKIPALVAKDHRLHATFLQAGTTTGRMASESPNLQNIPIRTEYGKRIRSAFAGDAGYVLAAIDYSQIELRIAAGLSGDAKLVEIFKRGEDVHAATASQVFGVAPDQVDREMRRRAKVINFGILYGMGVNALRANLNEGSGSVTREEAAQYLDQYFKNFKGIAAYIEKTKESVALLGYTETLFGRRRYFPGIKSALPNLRAQAERMAVNAPMQGTQSDIIKRAMIEADALIEKNGWRKKARLLLQVHDELVYEVDEKQAEVIAQTLRAVMENVVDAKLLSGVPIVAEASIGKDWGSVKRITR